MSLLSGNAYISGAASGIGRATALSFAQYGAKGLALSDINEAALVDTQKQIQSKYPQVDVRCYKIDVGDEKSIVDVITKVVEDYERLDYAINVAGIAGGRAPSTEISTEQFQKILNINLTGLWISMREQVRHMLKQETVPEGDHSKTRGVIVNIASMAGLIVAENISPYAASKHAVVGVTRTDAATYASQNIRINCVCPGYIKTPMLGARLTEQLEAELSKQVPNKRLAAPGEVASTITFLASPLSSYMNGAALVVDGGFSTV